MKRLHQAKATVFIVLSVVMGWSLSAYADDESLAIEVDRQPLAAALNSFSEQTGVQFAYVSTVADGIESPGTSGEASPAQALDSMLAETGLTYSFINDTTIVIAALSDSEEDHEGGDSNSKNLVTTPVLMAQTSTTSNTSSNTSSGQSNDGATSVVTGKVTDARTGANLKGALITVESTGQTTRTDDLGRFRIVGVPAGEQSIAVSFLGYAPDAIAATVRPGEMNAVEFALRGGSEVEEIVVYGQRSARAQALNKERSAQNVSTVLSSDLIGNFNATTISDALKRAPGVAFQENATGDASNIIVRGLAPDFNTLVFNGVELPVGNGQGRSASLENILADSIESVTISKTLLPNQDSSGTGGLVEIETKSPLDRPRRFASFLVEGAQRADDFSDEYLVSGTVSGKFGDRENIALSASAQYRDISTSGFSYNQSVIFGEFFPLEADGSTSIRSTRDINPEISFPFDPSATEIYPTSLRPSLNEIGSENLSITLSSEWRVTPSTNLRLDYQRSDVESTRFSRTSDFFTTLSYSEQPVNALDGEVRQALGFTGRVRTSQGLIVSPGDTLTTDVFSFRGETDIANWEFDYNAGYTIGKEDQEFFFLLTRGGLRTLEDAFISPAAVDAEEGRIISVFAPRSGDAPQVPLLTPAGLAALTDLENAFLSLFNTQGSNGENDRYVGGFSARRSFENEFVQYLELGIQYERSEFSSFSDDVRLITGNADLASLGFVNGPSDLSRIGLGGGLLTPTLSSSLDFVNNAFSIAENDDRLTITSIEQDPLSRQTFTIEDEFSGYIQTQVDYRNFEIIGGVRINRVEVEAVNRSAPSIRDQNGVRDEEFSAAFLRLITQRATQTDYLPRVLVNYRRDADNIIRAGYFLSVARPQVEQLSDFQTVALDLRERFGPNENQPTIRVSEGNPSLRPAVTHNFDISFERYNDEIGVIKLGAFYKRVEDSIQANFSNTIEDLAGVILPDDPRFTNLPDNIFVQVRRPENADDTAEIWGLEATYERQLTFLPGVWSGLGVFANYTYTDSSRSEPVVWNQPIFDETGVVIGREQVAVDLGDVRFDQQPAHSGTATVTYNNYGIDASLSYSYQDRRPALFRANNLSLFNEEVDSLDLRVEYRFAAGPANWRLYFEGTDLLDGVEDPFSLTSQGGEGSVPEAITGGNYIGGREFKLGLSATF